MKASFTAVAAIVVATAFSVPARADDYGPKHDVAAVRYDVPLLLAYVPGNDLAQVDIVIVDRDRALAAWHSNQWSGLVTLSRRSDRWWLTSYSRRAGAQTWWANPAPPVFALGGYSRPDLTAAGERDFLSSRTTPHLLDVAAERIPELKASLSGGLTSGFLSADSSAGFKPPIRSTTDGYDARLRLDFKDAYPSIIVKFNGRAPTPGEMPPTPNMNAYYFFSIDTDAMQPVAVAPSMLDIWFPFVLDPSGKYTLTLSFVNPLIDAIPGKLHDNVLHFDLPAMALPAGKTALGEIDGPFV